MTDDLFIATIGNYSSSLGSTLILPFTILSALQSGSVLGVQAVTAKMRTREKRNSLCSIIRERLNHIQTYAKNRFPRCRIISYFCIVSTELAMNRLFQLIFFCALLLVSCKGEKPAAGGDKNGDGTRDDDSCRRGEHFHL